LPDAINSVLSQELLPATLTIVDDGSTDTHTRSLVSSILQEYNFETIQPFVVSTKNQGLSKARNTGIRIGSSPYVCCLDADDYISDRYFIEILNIFKSTPDASFVSPLVQLVGDENDLWLTTAADFESLLRENTYAVSSVFRRDLWEFVNGYDEQMVHGYEDWDLWLSMLKNGGSGYICKESLLYHRKHGFTMTSSAKLNHDTIYKYLINKHC